MNCRHCKKELTHVFADLGFAPPSNAYVTTDDLLGPEKFYPLRVMVCDKCWLVQTEDFTLAGELFNDDYAYFSSASKSWLEHAEKFSTEISKDLNLTEKSCVIEIASNDGYLLKNFINMKIPCIGIEPTISTARAAEAYGIEVIQEFFTLSLAKKMRADGVLADLIVGNNVYAHVPDINDFTEGIKNILNKNGVVTLEFPHLLNLIKYNQFDTIYHEHFSYLSLSVVSNIFKENGLKIFNVVNLSTHGGSLRVYGCHESDPREISEAVSQTMHEEIEFGLKIIATYENFQKRMFSVKYQFLKFLLEAKQGNKKIVAYGAAAKGNTLLNYCGVKADLISFVADAAKSKQGKFLPGSHIPIVTPKDLIDFRPDYVIVFPWNIFDEVMKQLSSTDLLDTVFVTAIPHLELH